MIKVVCLDDMTEFFFDATDGYDAIQKMLYTLDLKKKDINAKIDLCNGRTWSLKYNDKTYACEL